MNKLTLLALTLLLTGCQTMTPEEDRDVYINTSAPDIGVASTATVGSVMYEHELCYGQDNGYGWIFEGSCSKYELSVAGILNDAIVLRYTEYIRVPNIAPPAFRMEYPWLIRDGFTRELQYPIDSKTIPFEDVVFEIYSTVGNTLSYKVSK